MNGSQDRRSVSGLASVRFLLDHLLGFSRVYLDRGPRLTKVIQVFPSLQYTEFTTRTAEFRRYDL
jgi:hypothetical protein